MVAIIDYGLGNLGSIANMLRVLGEKTIITSDKDIIGSSDHIILPGVGSFDAGMKNLEDKGLDIFVKEQAKQGKPILGICLGMQLLGMKSEEGKKLGLGLIPFYNKRFDFSEVDRPDIPDTSILKVPHMGWDIVDFKKVCNPLLEGITGQQRYYFVHSYHAVCDNDENVLMTYDYGYSFAASVYKDNAYGVQFHPEKSHDFGMRIFDNFVKNC